MSMRQFAFFLSAVATIMAQQPSESYRSWTSTDGKKIEATLLGVENGIAKIKLRTGAIYPVPLNRLSAEDQVFVKSSAASGSGNAANRPPAGKEWPRTVALDEPPEPVIVKEDKDTKEFIYRSPHYEFRCDSRLGTNVVKEFCRIFEATWKLNCVLPLDIKPQPEPGQEYFVARLFTDKEDYFKNGGIEGSAGTYSSGDKALIVPLDSLGVKMVGSRVSLEKSKEEDNATLVHEITHQMMNQWLDSMRNWFAEGSAECVAMLDYQRGRYSLTGLNRRLSSYLQFHYSDGKNFTMLDPEELLTITDEAWAAALGGKDELAAQNYASAALLTYYFYHLDDKGDSQHIIDYMRAIEKDGSAKEEEAAMQTHLIRGRSMNELRDDVKKRLRKEGVNVEFAPKGQNARTTPSK